MWQQGTCQSSTLLTLCEVNGIKWQRASNAERVSMWWWLHESGGHLSSHRYSIDSRYITVQYDILLSPAQQLRRQNCGHTSNSRKTPISRPHGRAMGFFFSWVIRTKGDREISGAHYIVKCICAPQIITVFIPYKGLTVMITVGQDRLKAKGSD